MEKVSQLVCLGIGKKVKEAKEGPKGLGESKEAHMPKGRKCRPL